MDKINWFGSPSGSVSGYVSPFFRIYKSKGQLILFIFDDRPESIPINSVRHGKIRAKKYLDDKIYEKFGE